MAKKKDDLPAMPFYTGDWFKAGDVRSLTVEQRGIWIDMLFFMWESNERGVLVDASGKPFTTEELGRMVGMSEDLLKQNLKQMESKKIFSLRDLDGAIFCRRMIKDAQIRAIRKEVGQIGGNQNKIKNLLKQNDKQTDKQNTENEIENETEVYKEESLRETNPKETTLEPVDERKSQSGGPTYGAVKEFFIQNNRSSDEALNFWNEYEQKKWHVTNPDGYPTRRIKTGRDWQLKAEQWIIKARTQEKDREKNKPDFLKKTENRTFRPAEFKKTIMCANDCGKPGIMKMGDDSRRMFDVCSRKCYEEVKIKNENSFTEIGKLIKQMEITT
jgi:hypothetical protein